MDYSIKLSVFFWILISSYSCSKETPDNEGPVINCIQMESVEGWSTDTLITGYVFSYPDYLKDSFPDDILKEYINDWEPFNYIELNFGTCLSISDPCTRFPYNTTISISPPTSDTLILRSMEAVKKIEVCNSDILHAVLYVRLDNIQFDIFNGLLFTYIKEEDTFYIGGDFYFTSNYLEDIIKISRSFTPLE